MDRSSQGSSLCVRVMRVQAKEDHIIAVRKVLESMKINEDDLDDDDDFMGDSPEVAFCACVLHGHANWIELNWIISSTTCDESVPTNSPLIK